MYVIEKLSWGCSHVFLISSQFYTFEQEKERWKLQKKGVVSQKLSHQNDFIPCLQDICCHIWKLICLFFFSGVLELCQYCLIFGLKTQIISLNMNSPLKTKQFWSCFIARFVPVSVFNIKASLLQLLPSVYRKKLTDPVFCF